MVPILKLDDHDKEGARNNKVKASYGETSVFFASLEDLIERKKAAGRPQDLEDLKYLKKIKEKGK